jgi:hypothetical protein
MLLLRLKPLLEITEWQLSLRVPTEIPYVLFRIDYRLCMLTFR